MPTKVAGRERGRVGRERERERWELTGDVVIEELAPLHQHGGELGGGDVAVLVHQGADGPRTGQRRSRHRHAHLVDSWPSSPNKTQTQSIPRSTSRHTVQPVELSVACSRSLATYSLETNQLFI